MEFIILTGMSGAGKSSASDALEDIGYLCIDNMPVAFIPKFAEMYSKTPNTIFKVCFIIDVRGEIEFDSLITELEQLKSKGYNCSTVFIDCDSGILVNRYKESRRMHPLVSVKNIGMNEAIELERKMLSPIRDYSDYVIDTTTLSIRELHDRMVALVSSNTKKEMMITCMSFGFKYGIATEADLVFDVRCLPNPYYVDELREKNGLDRAVSDFVFSYQMSVEFSERLISMLEFLIPLYVEEGKSQLTIAIGCTGGKHRSVAMAERLHEAFRDKYRSVIVHRDIHKHFDNK